MKGVIPLAKNTNKKKKPWWVKLLLALVIAVIVFLVFSVAMIRHFTGDTLSFHGTLAMVGYGGFELPEWFRNYVLDVDRSYEGLPELLTMEDGTPVTAENYPQRRAEMLEALKRYQYGDIPEQFNQEVICEESGEALDGRAVRKQYRLRISTAQGSADVMLLEYLPTDQEQCPVFLGLNFSGNTTVWDDPAILPSVCQSADAKPGSDDSWPVDVIIAQGCGVATMYYGDWAADDVSTYREAALSLFTGEPGEFTAYSAWAFGIMRGVDCLEMQGIETIATVGHSRLARVSVWAGANDERIDLVTASCGSGYQRSPILGRIARDGSSDHWYPEAHFEFDGRDSAYPVDMHMQYALVANRHLYISIGQNDLASDPVATFDALINAGTVWKTIYGTNAVTGIRFEDLQSAEPLFTEGTAIHMHSEGHVLNTEDWMQYIRYLKEFVL